MCEMHKDFWSVMHFWPRWELKVSQSLSVQLEVYKSIQSPLSSLKYIRAFNLQLPETILRALRKKFVLYHQSPIQQRASSSSSSEKVLKIIRIIVSRSLSL